MVGIYSESPDTTHCKPVGTTLELTVLVPYLFTCFPSKRPSVVWEGQSSVTIQISKISFFFFFFLMHVDRMSGEHKNWKRGEGAEQKKYRTKGKKTSHQKICKINQAKTNQPTNQRTKTLNNLLFAFITIPKRECTRPCCVSHW